MKTIMVLGDSTSMTIGLEKKTYPHILASLPVWPEGTRIVNCSQPGFTACDASSFFFRHARIPLPLGAVIIYLGNCDANATELKKGRYSRLRGLVLSLRERLGMKTKPVALRNKLMRFEWNDRYDPAIERAERPSDYKFNISRIVGYCRRRSIPVVLVKPVANFLFPAGLGKGNFLYYRYLGMDEKFSSCLSVGDDRFVRALESHERGEYADAMALYKKILEEPPPYFTNPEYPLIVANNYAVSAACKGNFKEAAKLLGLLLKERHIRREIILYNLAQTHRRSGDPDLYRKSMKEAYDADSSLYRVKDSYREALDGIASRFNDAVTIVDMGEFADSRLFIDHCHLAPDGQRRLAEKILDKLKYAKVATGKRKAEIRNILYNPELSLGNTKEFYRYYKTYAPYGEDDIVKEVDTVRRSYASHGGASPEPAMGRLSREMKRALEYYLKHPCLPSLEDILRFPPRYPSDIGRFPELFLARHIIPYLRMLEKDESVSSLFTGDQGLLRRSEELISVLPEDVSILVSADDPPMDPAFEAGRVGRILKKVRDDLVAHLKSGNKVHERLKTTIFWYFREILRWGPHSRASMRYDRLFLEYAAEALAVAGILDSKLNLGRRKEIVSLISHVNEADRLHARFAAAFDIEKDNAGLLRDYDESLLALAGKIERNAADMPLPVKT